MIVNAGKSATNVESKHSTPPSLGLIAGGGQFPFLVAQGARRAGCRLIVLAIRGHADPDLCKESDVFKWTHLARLGDWIRTLTRLRVNRCILAGSVNKTAMYRRFRFIQSLPDLTAMRLWFSRLPDKRTDTLLGALADVLAAKGITLENSVQYCHENLAPNGLLTGQKPRRNQIADIEFGWPIAKEIGRLDIGQSIAVKEQDVIAVEGIEGTDQMIERAGKLCDRGGWTLIKVAKPNQDMRFDVPTVGPMTIENLHRHGAGMLVFESGKTLIIDREQVLAAARRYNIVIVGRPSMNSECPNYNDL